MQKRVKSKGGEGRGEEAEGGSEGGKEWEEEEKMSRGIQLTDSSSAGAVL